MKLSELDLKFGPYLRREKSDIFVQKWTKEIHTQEYILSSLPDQTMSKYAEVEAYLLQLNEVLS
nr:tRNA (adenine(22)-N(1))-methyltransferase TrmK [Lactococcus fujiensis]